MQQSVIFTGDSESCPCGDFRSFKSVFDLAKYEVIVAVVVRKQLPGSIWPETLLQAVFQLFTLMDPCLLCLLNCFPLALYSSFNRSKN